VAEPTDIELMLRCREDPEALPELVRRYEPRLLAFIRRLIGDAVEAEDVFQDTFVRVMRAADRYEPRAAFSTWIFTIARNLCIDRLKKKSGLKTMPLEYAQEKAGGAARTVPRRDEAAGGPPNPLEAADTAEQVELLRAAITRLPETKREALVLRVQQGLPYSEIAEITGAPVGTIKYRVHEAIRLVAEELGVPRDQVSVRKSG
jgi:RNA polymerase sigma-70 factor (ECF subfamily)